MGNMKTRALHTYIDSTGKKHVDVVWFGSYGLIDDGFDSDRWDVSSWDELVRRQARFHNDKHESYSTKQQSVVDSLIQRMSVLKNELWYAMSYGLPLLEKKKSKVEFDSFILQTVSNHPDVQSILSFTSTLQQNNYSCSIKVLSVYGEVTISI